MTSDPSINTSSAYKKDTDNPSLHVCDELSSNLDSRRSCCRLKSQWSLSLFSLTDTTGKEIDLKETFAPSDRRAFYSVFKAIIFIWTLSTLIIEISITAHPNFWLAYLTNWGVIMCFATNLFSLLIFLYFLPYFNTFGRLNVNLETNIIRFIWATSVVTINIALLIVLLYWTLEYKEGQPVTYRTCMMHGVLALYTTIDVLVVNRIPMRLKQILLVVLFELVYFLWLMIHNFAGIGTPRTDEDPTTDDDAIYSVINWKKRVVFAVVVVIGVLLIATPILFSLLSYMSTLFKPRYVDDCVNSSDGEAIEDDEDKKQRDCGIDRSVP